MPKKTTGALTAGKREAGKPGAGTMQARKIFVSVGTHPQQFDRLLEEIDRLVGEKKMAGEVFAQTGASKYKPGNFAWKAFLSIDDFMARLTAAHVFITHAGEGNVGLAKNMGKKFIAVPRRKEFGEHTNDHQLELAQVVENKRLGLVAWNQFELSDKLEELEKFEPQRVERGNIPLLLARFATEEFE